MSRTRSSLNAPFLPPEITPLRLARGNYIGIIDDDEFPPADWLLRMYEGIQTFAVDGALGPVYPFFAGAPPAWLVKSGICELPVHRTGTILHWSQTRTGNVLVKKDVFEKHGLAFDLSSAPAARTRSSSGRPWHEDAGSWRSKKRLYTRLSRRCVGHGGTGSSGLWSMASTRGDMHRRE